MLLDTTQAVGWLPVDASRFAYTACGGYKWLLSPRGTAYFTINPALTDKLTPHYAGWYAGDDRGAGVYGGPLRLAADARRFDASPAWHAWVAAAPAVRLLAQVGTQSLYRHALSVANRFRAGIGMEPGDSAIVSLATNGAAADAMAAARIKGSARAGRLRLSFHVSTSNQDADLAADVLRRHVTSRPERPAGDEAAETSPDDGNRCSTHGAGLGEHGSRGARCGRTAGSRSAWRSGRRCARGCPSCCRGRPATSRPGRRVRPGGTRIACLVPPVLAPVEDVARHVERAAGRRPRREAPHG